MVQLSHPYTSTGKTIALTVWTFVSKVMSLVFNMLSRFVIAFLPRSKCLNFMIVVTIYSDFGAQENEVSHCFQCLSIYLPWNEGTGCHALCLFVCLFVCFFECWVLSQLFHSPLSPSFRGSLIPLNFLPLEWYHLHIWGCWYFPLETRFQFVI